MLDSPALLPKSRKPYRAFLARKGETPFSRSNEDAEEAELLRTSPKDSFEILQAQKTSTAPEYAYYVQAVYNEFGKNAVLVFRHQIIRIHGENLQDLVLSIRRKTCAYIQVFNERKHLPPKENEAIVTKVEIKAGKALEDIFLEMDMVIEECLSRPLVDAEEEQSETLPEPV